MYRKFAFAAALSLSAVLPLAAHAGTTVVESGTGIRGLQIAYYGPVGQSFTATGTNLTSFGFQFETFNPGQPNAPVTLQLLSGAGLSGALIASRTATLPTIPATRTGTWYDFDLTGTTLVAGQTYTALLSTTSSLLGLVYGPDLNIYTGQPLGGDAYAGGKIVSTRALDTYCTTSGACDTNFRFTTADAAAAVPEPATWAMMLMGFGAMGAAARHRRKTKVSFA